MSTDREAVRDTLQAGYGDSTQTVLDDQVASQVIASLRARGYCSAQEVAAIVYSAGGEVTLTDEALRHLGDLELLVTDGLDRRVIARRRA